MKDSPSRRSIALFLKSKTQASGQCWEWTGALHGVGYGAVPQWCGGGRYAHRAMYSAMVGEIPKGMYVLHSCDNRKCVNPEHLFLGTHLDNIKDMHSKNRQRGGSMPNESNPSCKFSDDLVRQIREAHKLGSPKREIERKYGVSETHYYRLVRGLARKEAM